MTYKIRINPISQIKTTLRSSIIQTNTQLASKKRMLQQLCRGGTRILILPFIARSTAYHVQTLEIQVSQLLAQRVPRLRPDFRPRVGARDSINNALARFALIPDGFPGDFARYHLVQTAAETPDVRTAALEPAARFRRNVHVGSAERSVADDRVSR